MKQKQYVNVVPVNDLRPHQENENCPCAPRIEYHGRSWLVIHNSYDGREMFEYEALAFARKLENH